MSKLDRLEALFKHKHSNIGKLSHSSERAALNNEDKKFNKIVYDNEIKQANLYNQSVMPDPAKDIGVSFKINQYVIRLSQILGTKSELEKVLSAQFSAGVPLTKLRGTTREAQVIGEFFKKSDSIATFNELISYINTFGNDIRTDDSFRQQIYNSSINPLVDLFNATAALYPAFFQSVPPPTNVGKPEEKTDERKVYETVRQQSLGCYSVYSLMASNLNNYIFRPITKEEVEKYIVKENIKAIFTENPLAPQPAPAPAPLDPLAPQPAPLPPAPAVLPVLEADNEGVMDEIIVNYEQQQNPPRLLLKSDFMAAYEAFKPQLDARFKPLKGQAKNTFTENLKNRIRETLAVEGFDPDLKRSPAAIQALEQAYAQRGGPAQPAPQPAQPVGPAPQQQTPARQAFIDNGGTPQPNQIPELNQGESASVFQRVKEIENRLGVVLAPNQGDGKILYDELPAQIQNKLRRMGTQDELPEETAIQDSLLPFLNQIKQQRQYWGNQQQPPVQSAELYGLGREGNDRILTHILDYENLARRQVKPEDYDSLMAIKPELKQNPKKTMELVGRLNEMRKNEPNSWGKEPIEIKQGMRKRALEMPMINEFDPKAEALKRYGKIMSGGCADCSMRGGMNNSEQDWSGYGEVDNEENTPFKRHIIGMPNPFAPKNPPSSQPAPFLPYNENFDDEEDLKHFKNIFLGEAPFYAEQEKPIDLDAHADAIRKNNENYKVNTGKMKSVKYTN
jgi:hypothetical protein